jgi:hypothetical protein
LASLSHTLASTLLGVHVNESGRFLNNNVDRYFFFFGFWFVFVFVFLFVYFLKNLFTVPYQLKY